MRFAEYVARRDETSFNPMPYGGGGALQTGLGIAASPVAALSGLGQLMPKASAYKAFEPARDFLLDAAVKAPQIKDYLLWVLNSAENYIQTQKPTEIAGVTMGKQAGMIGKVSAPLLALMKAAWTSLRNVVHTIGNVQTVAPDKIAQNVQNMLYGLDTIPKQDAINRIEEFKQRLEAGAGSETIDKDARMYQPFFSR